MSGFGRISDRWVEVALACADAPRTTHGISTAIGAAGGGGSVKDLVASMEKRGFLEPVPDDGKTKWKLTRKGRAELRKAEPVGYVTGLLPPGERLLLVLDQGRGVSEHALAQLADDPQLRWCARLDGHVRFAISFGTGDAQAIDRAQRLLDAEGISSLVARADAFFDRAKFRDYTQASTAPLRALPS
jgi:DNA-binding MarR family transcriptional regulator